MRELLLIGVLGTLGIAFALVLARQAARGPSAGAALERIDRLRNGGIERYLRRHNLVVVAAAAVLGAALFLVYGIAHQIQLPAGIPWRQFGLWLLCSFALGVGLGLFASWAAARSNCRACARAATAVQRSLDDAMRGAVRSAAVSGLGATACGLLGLGGLLLFGIVSAPGSTWADRAQHLCSVSQLVMHLGGFVLGIAFVALLGHLGGGLFGKVADIGGDVAGTLEGSLPEDSRDNPATLADLVGDAVGDHAARTVGMLATIIAHTVGAMLAAALLFQGNADVASGSATVLFPLVTQSFSLLSAGFGVMVVRTDDREGPHSALARGLLVATLLQAVSAMGTAKWLLGASWAPYSWCVLLGAAASVACLYLVQYYSDARFRPVRTLAEAARGGPTQSALRGAVAALEGGGALLGVVAVTALGGYALGQRSGLSGGGLLGLGVAGLGLLGSAPLMLASDGMASIVDSARGMVEMTVGSERSDVHARARMLDAVGAGAKGLSGALAAAASTLACLLLVGVFQSELGQRRGGGLTAGAVEDSGPLVCFGALAGLLVVLAFSWATLTRLAQSVRALILELRAQLGSAPPPPGEAEDRAWQGPLGCVEIVSRHALRGMLPPALLGVGVPLLIGAALRLWSSGDRVTGSAEALVALVLVATIAGALGSLLFSTAGSAWDNAKKYIQTGAHGGRFVPDPHGRDPRGASPTRRAGGAGSSELGGSWTDNPTYVAAAVGDTIGDSLKGLVGPALQALVKTLAALVLVFSPLFL